MNLSSSATVLVGLTVAAAGALIAVSAHKSKSSGSTERPQQSAPLEICLEGPVPITVEFLKKPVPILSVYQY